MTNWLNINRWKVSSIILLMLLLPTGGFGQYVWMRAEDLKSGDKVLLTNGQALRIAEIHATKKDQTVFNFSVDELHNYYVGEEGVLAHNDDPNCLLYRRQLNAIDEELDLRLKYEKKVEPIFDDVYSDDPVRQQKGT